MPIVSQPPDKPTSAEDEPLLAVAVMFSELGDQLLSINPAACPPTVTAAYDAVAQTAVRQVRGAQAASITTYRNGKFTTVTATDPRALQADAIQYAVGSGPCVDAILEQTIYHPSDLRRDHRWPVFGERANQELGWASMLSYRLSTSLMADDVAAGLNIYSERPAAFDHTAVRMGLLLATHGALAIAAETGHIRSRHLERALESSREIGVAMGVLMHRHGLTRQQAFDLLRICSQNTNRKLADIAADVGDTGYLDLQATVSAPPVDGRGRGVGQVSRVPTIVDDVVPVRSARAAPGRTRRSSPSGSNSTSPSSAISASQPPMGHQPQR
ncbi:MAG TPA: GAF and ANTAR domain-containing protein [Pseudonocardia sp.]|jgi:hypothetical protein